MAFHWGLVAHEQLSYVIDQLARRVTGARKQLVKNCLPTARCEPCCSWHGVERGQRILCNAES